MTFSQIWNIFIGLILIFEWWYYRKYGTSFIEQVSLNHISPWLGGNDNVDHDSPPNPSTFTTEFSPSTQLQVSLFITIKEGNLIKMIMLTVSTDDTRV